MRQPLLHRERVRVNRSRGENFLRVQSHLSAAQTLSNPMERAEAEQTFLRSRVEFRQALQQRGRESLLRAENFLHLFERIWMDEQ